MNDQSNALGGLSTKRVSEMDHGTIPHMLSESENQHGAGVLPTNEPAMKSSSSKEGRTILDSFSLSSYSPHSMRGMINMPVGLPMIRPTTVASMSTVLTSSGTNVTNKRFEYDSSARF